MMPRAEKSGKPRQDKDKKKAKKKDSKQSPSKKRAVVAEEDEKLCPGNLREKEWNALVFQEEGEIIAFDLVGEIVAAAERGVYEAVIQHDVTPFTLEKTKEDIINVIEMLFITRDPGEAVLVPGPEWLPDEEPVPAPIDSWARGSLPLMRRVPPPSTPSVVSSVSGTRRRRPLPSATPASEPAATPTAAAASGGAGVPIPPPAAPPKARTPRAPPRRPRPANEAPKPKSSPGQDDVRAAKRAEANESDLEARKEFEKTLQKMKNKDFTFDHEGHVVPVKRVVADHLPSHKVEMMVQVAPDPDAEPKGRRRTVSGKGGPRPTTSEKQKTPRTPRPATAPDANGTAAGGAGGAPAAAGATAPGAGAAKKPPRDDRGQKPGPADDRGIKAGPVVAEMLMKMTPGVTFKAGERVRQGAKRKSDPRHLSRSEYEAMIQQRYETKPLMRSVPGQEAGAVMLSETTPIVSHAIKEGEFLPPLAVRV